MGIDLVHRTRGIVLRPREEWIKIKKESLSIPHLFSSCVLILASIPPAARFLANLLYGNFKRPYSGWSWNVAGRDLLFSVFTYIFSLIVVYIVGRIINVLAPSFSSQRNSINSMKLAVYSMVPYWTGGVLYFIPRVGWILKIFVGFYGIYILYLGLVSSLMDTPKGKINNYLVAGSILAVILIVGVEVMLKLVFAVWGVVRVT